MGERLGKYDLLERVGVGGMAELFLARASAQHGFEKTVALKRILPAFAENPDFIRMFMAEAQLAASLHHPNIAQVFDFGEEEGTYFFTMEYVHGRNLREILAAASKRSAGMPLASVLHIISSLAAGLHHAHEHRDADGTPLQIVHRDISPSNVIVTYEGDVKLVDFGIAKAASLGPATLSGSLKGKIAYMSPEQCRGELVDRRSDVFSLGTLLWELTTGRRLFTNESNDMSLLAKVEKAEIPRPTKLIDAYPEPLESVVLRAMARNRDDRYSTALDFRVALEDFAQEARLPVSSTRLSQYMDALFPKQERPPVPITSSFPSLRGEGPTPTPTPVKSLSKPGLPRSLGGASTSSSTRKGPAAETVVSSRSLGSSTASGAVYRDPKPNRAWILVALLLLLGAGIGGYLLAGRGDAEPKLEPKTATAVDAEADVPADATAEATPDPKPQAQPSASAATAEPTPEAMPAAAERAPNRKARKKNGRKKSSVQPPTESTPTVEPTEPEPAPAAPPSIEPEPAAPSKSSDIFLPRRGASKPTSGPKKPTADDFL